MIQQSGSIQKVRFQKYEVDLFLNSFIKNELKYGLESYCGKYIYKAVLFNQQMISQVEKYIHEALSNNDNVVRRKAEANLFKLANEVCTDFFVSIANIISDNNKKKDIRQAACTVFSRLASFKVHDNVCYWDKVQGNMKVQIKQKLLSTLILTDPLIVRGGANTIATIASIQIPRGQWLDIVITLAQNTQHEEFYIRKASVITLGFICQQLKTMKQTINNHVSCQQILGGLLMSLQKQGELVEIALQALRDSIPFLKNIFMQQIDYSNKMFQFIMPILQHKNYRQKVYQILFQFAKYCYDLLENYLGWIIEFTMRHIQSRNDDAKFALSLWQTIGTQYLQRKEQKFGRLNEAIYALPNYIIFAHKSILPEVMGCIIILTQRDLQFDQMRASAINTLSIMIECGNRQMVQMVTDGVSRVLISPNPGQRQASVPLFSSLCHYEDKEQIETRFKLGFNHLYTLLHDSAPIVVKNTLSGFESLSQSFPQVFLMNSEIKQIIFHLLGMSKSQDQDINIMSLTILNNITEVLKENPDLIGREAKTIITEVVKMFDAGLQQGGSKQVGEKLIILLMNIIMFTDQVTIINQLVEHLIMQYKHYINLNIRDKQLVLEHIITVLHTCLLALSKSVLPNIQHKEPIFQLIDTHIQTFGIQTQGFNMISAANSCFKSDTLSNVGKYWDTIMQGLSYIEQKGTFRAAISCISDIARVNQMEAVGRLNLVFEKLVNYMHSNIQRELKTEILKCFGDLTLGMKRNCTSYIGQILEIVDNCINAVYMFQQIQAEKVYAEQLKQALVEMYHCVVFATNSQDKANHQMATHFQVIAQFIVKTCDVKYQPTVDYLKNGLYLIFDSALFYLKNQNYRKLVDEVLDSPQIKKMVEIIKRYEDRPDIKELLSFIHNKGRGR